MTTSFLNGIDVQMWRQTAATPNAHAAGGSICSDMRNDITRHPFVFQLVSAAILNRFNIVQKAWGLANGAMGLAGTFGAAAATVFAPSLATKGTLLVNANTSKVSLSTALPTAVGLNMLANRGGSGDTGFRVRVCNRVTGRTAERYIVGNTAGTTPVLDLDAPLPFATAAGDLYEIIGGRVFALNAGTLAAGIWKSYEVAANTLASALSTTNLPATIATDTSMLALDETYVPFDHLPGEGFVKGAYEYDGAAGKKALAATAAGASSLTGQLTGGDFAVVANEYRNFQIRIVEDATNPTAVGQRGIIASHTAGPNPVYTMGAAWGVLPSAAAKYVIEYPNLILVRSSATTSIYAYNYSDASFANGTITIAAGAWSTGFAVAPAANAVGGFWVPSFGIQPDVAKNARHSFCYFFRGASATVDVFDLAGAAAGAWVSGVVIDGAITLTTGTSACYSPFGNEGRYAYVNIYTASAVNQMFRFDTKNRVLTPVVPTDRLQAGTAVAGNRMAAVAAVSVTPKMDLVVLLNHLSVNVDELIPLV